MTRAREVSERIVESGVLAVLRGIDEDQIVPVARAIHDAGVGALEVTADGTRAAEQIAAVDRELADTDAVVGGNGARRTDRCVGDRRGR